MGTDEPNQNDRAGELHGAIVRQRARELRIDQRRYAILLNGRGWEPAAIARALDVEPHMVRRLLAADGLLLCTECAFDRHDACTRWYSDTERLIACECAEDHAPM
jgi:hypothetical protein